MFSNPKKFLKKNILLIGIVLFVILIVAYFLFMYNSKEGFDGALPPKAGELVKVELIPVSTIEKFYNKLPNQNTKNILAPIVELYKLFAANYDDAFAVAFQINASQKELAATLAKIRSQSPAIQPGKLPAEINAANDIYRAKYEKELSDLNKKWEQIINPGIQKVLINAIRWLPTAKRFYDKFVSNNYYGLMAAFQPMIIDQNGQRIGGLSASEAESKQLMMLTILSTLINVLWYEDQLSIVFGLAFAKSNPKPPIPLPINAEKLLEFIKNTPRETSMSILAKGEEYMTNLSKPFAIIQEYLIKSVITDMTGLGDPSKQTNGMQQFIQNNPIPNTIIQLIEQLNTALANDAIDQATITNLEGKVDELQSNSLFNVSTNVMPTWSSSSDKPTTDKTKTTNDKTTSTWSPWTTTDKTTDKTTSTWSPWSNTDKTTDKTKTTTDKTTDKTTSAWSPWSTADKTTSTWSPWTSTTETKTETQPRTKSRNKKS